MAGGNNGGGEPPNRVNTKRTGFEQGTFAERLSVDQERFAE